MSKNQFCGYDVHPAANLFPMMTEEEFDSLKADIKKHGQIIPVVLYRDQILDGRNRAMACNSLGFALKVVNKDEIEDPISWAISANAKRRNLTPTQLATVAVESERLYKEEAEKRMKAGTPAPNLVKGGALEKAAKAAGVSKGYAIDAKAIKERAPDVFEKMKSGELSMSEAKERIKPIPQPEFTASEKEKIKEADEDSEQLWTASDAYKKLNKADRAKFNKRFGLTYEK